MSELHEHNQCWLVLLGPWSADQLQGVTWPNPYSRAARPWTGPPYPRAPRLGPRAFSVGSVVSFGVNCVCQHQLRERTFRSSSTNGCYADKAGICCTKSDVRKWALRRSAFDQCVANINDLFGSCRFRIEKRLSRSHPDFPSGNFNRGEVKPR